VVEVWATARLVHHVRSTHQYTSFNPDRLTYFTFRIVIMFGLSTFLWSSNVHLLWKRIRMALLHFELGPLKTRLGLVNTQTAKLRYMTDIMFIIEVRLPSTHLLGLAEIHTFGSIFSATHCLHGECLYCIAGRPLLLAVCLWSGSVLLVRTRPLEVDSCSLMNAADLQLPVWVCSSVTWRTTLPRSCLHDASCTRTAAGRSLLRSTLRLRFSSALSLGKSPIRMLSSERTYLTSSSLPCRNHRKTVNAAQRSRKTKVDRVLIILVASGATYFILGVSF